MRHFMKIAIIAGLFASPVYAEGCNHGLTNEAKPFVENAIQLRINKQYERAITTLKRTPAGANPSFCIQYEIGRNLLNIDALDDALKQLQDASGNATQEDRSKQAIFNIIGYTWLQKKEYSQAIMAFERQLNDDMFTSLPRITQTKVFNNTGYTYLKLNQYPAARLNFEKALANGSKLAAANITKLDSLISVQSAGDIDIPGIFSVALSSQRSEVGLTDELNRFAEKLGVPSTEISVYRRENGMLTFTYGNNLSYPKAQKELERALAVGEDDAQMVSTANWENLSFSVNQPQLVKALRLKSLK